MGKINTNTLLLIGAGAVAVYLLTQKKATAPTQPVYVNVPSGGGSGITTSQYVAIGTQLAGALRDIFA